VRGQLCQLCNAAIGCARDEIRILVRAVAYLYSVEHAGGRSVRAELLVRASYAPHCARSIGKMIDFAIRWAEQGQDLLMERGEMEHEHLGTSGGLHGQAVNALKALKNPAHRRPLGRLVELVEDGLARER
jgi:hypothetical protein